MSRINHGIIIIPYFKGGKSMKRIIIILISSICIILIGLVGNQFDKPMRVYESNVVKRSSVEVSPKKALNIPRRERLMSNEVEHHDIGEQVAQLSIPKIDSQYTTYWGTDEATLDQGVGMYVSEWTVTPDVIGHVVMSGHRNTVFSELGLLDVEDVIEVEYEGETYTYRINDTWITDADDRTVIVNKDEPTLTLTTCYPFDYIGAAPDRYIIQATREN